MIIKKLFKELLRSIEGSLEVGVLLLIYYFSFKFLYNRHIFPLYGGRGGIVLLFVYALLIFLIFNLNDGFKYGRLKLSHISVTQTIDILIVNIITYFQLCLIANQVVSVIPLIIQSIIDIFVCFAMCYFFTYFYHKTNTPRNMLLVYGNDRTLSFLDKANRELSRGKITNAISSENGLEMITSIINNYDAVVINDVEAERRNDILKYCYENKIRTYIVPKISDILIRGSQEINLLDTPVLLVKGKGLTLYQKMLKRVMDVILCLVALIISSPIMLAVAIAIKLEDHGPVFYKQERITKDLKKFNIIKFRSMIVNAEKDGKSIPATDNDPRITKVGKIIRRFRIDELPQIFNILSGDMSIVGPRPERTEHVEKYCKEIPEFKFRYKVKGGLTGYAQIYGRYNTTPYDKLRLDLIYIENYSLLLDIKLIIETVRILFSKESTEGFAELKQESEDIDNKKRGNGDKQ